MKKHFFKVFMLSLGLTGATSMFAASYGYGSDQPQFTKRDD